MKIHKIQQQTEEWFEVKKGKMSASHANTIATAGKGLDTYILELMADYFAEARDEGYTNEAMQRGNEFEAEAREEYEFKTGSLVEEVGFCEYNDYVGCSPDGLVGEDGGIEIKCHNNKIFFQLLLEEEIDKKYWWQIQMNLLITGRKWWDYVGFNKNYKQRIKVIKVLPDPEAFKKLEKGFEIGEKKIKEIIKKFNK